MLGSVVDEQTLEQQLVVDQPLDGLDEEHGEGQIAHLLHLELFKERVEALVLLAGRVQLGQQVLVLFRVEPIALEYAGQVAEQVADSLAIVVRCCAAIILVSPSKKQRIKVCYLVHLVFHLFKEGLTSRRGAPRGP